MHISNQIHTLVNRLTALLPEVSNNTLENRITFNSLLEASLVDASENLKNSNVKEQKLPQRLEKDIPNWVDPAYFYDPTNPRKPNQRELMEAISKQSMEEMHSKNVADWIGLTDQTSDILYGVLGSDKDARDWEKIMNSSDILHEARLQTGEIYQPIVDIVHIQPVDGQQSKKTAVLTDGSGKVLRTLSDNVKETSNTLLNFGTRKSAIPADIKQLGEEHNLNRELTNFLASYNGIEHIGDLESLVIKNSVEALSNKLSKHISIDELDKL